MQLASVTNAGAAGGIPGVISTAGLCRTTARRSLADAATAAGAGI